MRRGTATPEAILGLAALALVVAAAFALAQALAVVWGVQRAAEAALLEVRLRGTGADPEGAARAALSGTPLLPMDPSGPAVAVAADPPDPSAWRFGARVRLSVSAAWTAGGGASAPAGSFGFRRPLRVRGGVAAMRRGSVGTVYAFVLFARLALTRAAVSVGRLLEARAPGRRRKSWPRPWPASRPPGPSRSSRGAR